MKFLYKITPFLLLRILSVVFAIYYLSINTNNEGWGFVLVFAMLLFVFVCFIIELLLKLIFSNRKNLILIESVIILTFITWSQYQNRKIIFQLPEGFSGQYVTVIYNVENEQKLEINNFYFWKNIEVSKKGVILTSSNISKYANNIDFKTFNGVYYMSDNSNKIFIKELDSEFEYNNKIYKFSTWRLGEGNSMLHRYEISEIHRKDLIEFLKQNLESLITNQ